LVRGVYFNTHAGARKLLTPGPSPRGGERGFLRRRVVRHLGTLPQWYAGDEFEAARKAAIEAVRQ
jgi:hypothetical protein